MEITEAGLIQTLNNLVVGRYVCCQEGAKRMIEAGRGSIINIVSIAGLSALGRGHMAYSIAMGGVAQMTREMSTEWSSRGVRVNAIVCAQIMNKDLERRIGADAKLGNTYLRGIPIGRLGEIGRYPGPGDFPGLRRLQLGHRRHDAAGWGQHGQECGRVASGHA